MSTGPSELLLRIASDQTFKGSVRSNALDSFVFSEYVCSETGSILLSRGVFGDPSVGSVSGLTSTVNCSPFSTSSQRKAPFRSVPLII